MAMYIFVTSSDAKSARFPSNDGVQDTKHFLLHCHSYDKYRRDPLGSLNSTLQTYGLPNLTNSRLLRMMLYGDERLPVDSNSEILKATLRYIYLTKRFDQIDATET